LPETASELMPNIPRNIVGTLAVNCTVEVTVPFDLATVTLSDKPLHPLLSAISPLKMLVASVTPAGIGPSCVMVVAAAIAGELFATGPPAAASAAACSMERYRLASP